jgi:hypothetical protein
MSEMTSCFECYFFFPIVTGGCIICRLTPHISYLSVISFFIARIKLGRGMCVDSWG